MSFDLTEALVALQPALTAALALFGVWLGWRLSGSSRRIQRRLDRVRDRILALSEVVKVVDNVPPDLGREQLIERLARDPEFQKSLTQRLVRLFGLRTELIATIDPDVAGFIDERLRPLFEIGVGRYDIRTDRVSEFGAAAVELRVLVKRVEKKLVEEFEQLTASAA